MVFDKTKHTPSDIRAEMYSTYIDTIFTKLGKKEGYGKLIKKAINRHDELPPTKRMRREEKKQSLTYPRFSIKGEMESDDSDPFDLIISPPKSSQQQEAIEDELEK